MSMQTQSPQLMSYGGHLRALAVLGLPLMGGQMAQFAIGLTDALMLGWYSVEALAAVTLASSYFFVWFIFGSGFAFAVMPMVASAAAKEDHRRIRRATRMGLWLSLGYGMLAMPALWFAEPILLALGQTAQVAADAGTYLQVAGWGLLPALLGMVMKSYLSALEHSQAVLWRVLLAAVINGAANYVLIFGHFGAPELGLQGAAIASVLTQGALLIAFVPYCLRHMPEHELLRNIWQPDWQMLREIIRHGVPIGLTTLCEVSLFAATAMMMGWLGTVALAAHGIAINLAGMTFMLHLGLSNAATIRVGNALGRADKAHMVRGALVVTGASAAVSVLTAAVFLLTPEPLILLFLDPNDPLRPQIMATGVLLLAMAGLFQLMDGMQAIALGLLRGLLDTGRPLVIAAFGYWGIGMPAAYALGFQYELGGLGVWIGLVLGLSVAGGLLMWRFWRHPVARFEALARENEDG